MRRWTCLLVAGGLLAVEASRSHEEAWAQARPLGTKAVDTSRRCGGSGAVDPEAGLATRAVAVLACHGYADVAAVVDGPRLAVTFENTRYRDERRGLREAAQLLLSELGPGQELVLVPSNRAVPLVAARYPAGPTGAADRGFLPELVLAPDISLDVSGVPSALADAPRTSRSFGRVDLVIHPWFEALFGDFDNPVASRTGVAPEVRVALRRGLSLSAQVLVTLQDDMETSESRVRPALVTLNQTTRLPRNVFVSATAGTFNPDRYGMDVEARAYFANGRLSAGAELGLTGEISYRRDGWLRAPMNGRTALVDAAWRIDRYDLLLRTTAGAFLDGERGVRLDVVRQFGELEIGWFLLGSDEGANGGVTLRLPLLPARRPRHAAVRLFATDAFRWQYRYRGHAPSGRRYNTGNALEDFGRRLNPDYVTNGHSNMPSLP